MEGVRGHDADLPGAGLDAADRSSKGRLRPRSVVVRRDQDVHACDGGIVGAFGAAAAALVGESPPPASGGGLSSGLPLGDHRPVSGAGALSQLLQGVAAIARIAPIARFTIHRLKTVCVFGGFWRCREVLQQQEPVSGPSLPLSPIFQVRMLVGPALVAVLPPAGAVVAFHHLDGFLAGDSVDVGPLPDLVRPVGFYRLRQPVFRKAQVPGDAVLHAHPGLFVSLVLVAMEVHPAVFLVGPASVGVVAADVAGPGVEAEPAPAPQAGRIEPRRRRRSVRFLQGEGVCWVGRHRYFSACRARRSLMSAMLRFMFRGVMAPAGRSGRSVW